MIKAGLFVELSDRCMVGSQWCEEGEVVIFEANHIKVEIESDARIAGGKGSGEKNSSQG